MLGAELARISKNRKPDILRTYEALLALSPRQFHDFQPQSALEKMVKNSIVLAMEDPESGESHRIYNRLIGKPREMSLSLNVKADLKESQIAKAVESARAMFPEINGEKGVEVKEETKVALENLEAEAKIEVIQTPKKRGRPPKAKALSPEDFKAKMERITGMSISIPTAPEPIPAEPEDEVGGEA